MSNAQGHSKLSPAQPSENGAAAANLQGFRLCGRARKPVQQEPLLAGSLARRQALLKHLRVRDVGIAWYQKKAGISCSMQAVNPSGHQQFLWLPATAVVEMHAFMESSNATAVVSERYSKAHSIATSCKWID